MSALRAIARKVRNRLSAQESRERKKSRVQELESAVEESSVVNRGLRDRVSVLEKVNRKLLDQLHSLQVLVAGAGRARSGAGTCLMLLALSFSMVSNPGAGAAGHAGLLSPQLLPATFMGGLDVSPKLPAEAGVNSISDLYTKFLPRKQQQDAQERRQDAELSTRPENEWQPLSICFSDSGSAGGRSAPVEPVQPDPSDECCTPSVQRQRATREERLVPPMFLHAQS